MIKSNTRYVEAGLGLRVFAGLIDASLSLGLVTALAVTGKPEVFYYLLPHINPTLLVLILFVVYRLVSLLFFNQTLGMRIFRLTLLNGEEQQLNYLEKLLAAFFILYRGTAYYYYTR